MTTHNGNPATHRDASLRTGLHVLVPSFAR